MFLFGVNACTKASKIVTLLVCCTLLLQVVLKSIEETSKDNQKQKNAIVEGMTQSMSDQMYPGVPHSWLCEGSLLRLIDPSHSGNYRIFQVCLLLP